MPVQLSEIRRGTLYSLSEAAALVGKSLTTLRRYIRDRKLKARKQQSGMWVVSGDELRRVFGGEERG